MSIHTNDTTSGTGYTSPVDKGFDLSNGKVPQFGSALVTGIVDGHISF